MFLEKVEYWDFRKYKSNDDSPGLIVNLQKGMNLIVGENDAGKTAIIDGIKLLLGTLSDDYDRISDTDFYTRDGKTFKEELKIVGYFTDLSYEEAAKFLEWISFTQDAKPLLKVTLKVTKKKNPNGNEYFDRKIYGGDYNSETVIDSERRQLLRAIYLKPLRDAQRELRPGPYSRLSNILSAHPQVGESGKQELLDIVDKANGEVKEFFSKDEHNVVQLIMNQLETFYDKNDFEKSKIAFNVSEANIYSILSRLSLDTESVNLGLGNSNLLYIAVELLLMRDGSNYIGPRIALIEEIEAHLHTQAQIRLIKHMESNSSTQFILTTHSTNLASSINPKNLILLYNNQAFSMAESETLLKTEDYEFLERFLDATKSNLFFAKGLIFVEGDAENLLLPTFAELIGYPLHEYGISIVNIGNTAFERYIKLFSRSGADRIQLPISIITDVDVRPLEYYKDKGTSGKVYIIGNQIEFQQISSELNLESDLPEEDRPYGTIFSTKKNLIDGFGLKQNFDESQLENKVVKDLNEEHIEELIRIKNDTIIQKYDDYNANSKTFVAPEWTLEYSLAKSPLVKLLWKSIHETRYKEPYSTTNKEKFDKINNLFTDGSESISAELAYNVFKSLNDKVVSKAIVAQKLAIEIGNLDNEGKEQLKSEVLSNKYTQYLVDAIKHAAQINEEEGCTDE
ncbi:ATP-dependent endonuclease [uncultured Streptococcus sp.]|uniref:ATP-dependent nuclease n=1 Tax=uncultured Streptococcus sp. TaxID=83427 RepID=UPI00261BE0AF|nr:AAA family ATPase [uncultured Streptococcus sp.]